MPLSEALLIFRVKGFEDSPILNDASKLQK
jgi:hypothetical protein